MKRALPFLLALAIVLPVALHADELKLKDGASISGTIVGFEKNSFRVKTSYGFAVVQKDQVVSISIKDAAPNAAKPTANDEQPRPKVAAQKPVPGVTKTDAGEDKAAADSASAPAAAPTPAAPKAMPADASPPASAADAATPASEPQPVAIREEVTGNRYSNFTYGFQMYKPPDWQVIASARAILPGSITAMGTEDQTTYLLIGQQPTGKSIKADVSAAEDRLREILDNFRPLGETRVTISGLPAIEHKFRGSVDEHDWSGTVVYLPRGAQLYTIFGMTRADSDLVQIQENVISRTISSIEFTKP